MIVFISFLIFYHIFSFLFCIPFLIEDDDNAETDTILFVLCLVLAGIIFPITIGNYFKNKR